MRAKPITPVSQKAPVFWTCCQGEELVHFNPTWTYRRHKTQMSTQKALDRRYPGLVGYVNSGLHPQGRRQSAMAICCVGVSGLQSSGMRKELVVVVRGWTHVYRAL